MSCAVSFSCLTGSAGTISPSMFWIASSSCNERSAPSMGKQAVSFLSPYIFARNAIFPSTILGWSAKYELTGMPSSVLSRCTQSGSMEIRRSRFCKNRISIVTSVPAFALKALFGSRIAPRSSARSARYLRTEGLALSSVPFEVRNATTPPGRTLSSARAKK